MTAPIQRMFPYFGSKWSAAKKYPPPRHCTIVEPFAGGAAYSLHYPDRDVVLCDVYQPVVDVWTYLTTANPRDVLDLPDVPPGETIPDSVRGPARALIGFWCASAGAHPQSRMRKQAATRPKSNWGPEVRRRIADAMPRIRHWMVVKLGYADAPNGDATWFVDPPYQQAGRFYVHGSKGINYKHLGEWCRTRAGQVIVCENEGADWLPFQRFGEWRGATRPGVGRQLTREVIWVGGA